MRERTKVVVVALLILAAFVLAGTNDYQEAIAQEKRTAEILALAPGWVATR
jgi:hypothetical protein